MKKFVLIGAAGFVAPRHMKAIKDVGGDLIACLDPYDSVGVLDSYFPDCKYFSEFERFDRYCVNQDIDYTVVCSPNYLHDAHCRFGLRIGSDVICEKPLVLREHNLIDLRYVEDNTEHRIWNILQLRLSDTAIQLKKLGLSKLSGTAYLEYYTPRGDWYDYSWKSNVEKSGGIVSNIGIHLIDLLLWLFGKEYTISRWKNNSRSAYGMLRIGNFEIPIILSIKKGLPPRRMLSINVDEFDLSKNFGDLHTLSYQKILSGEGFGIEDVRPAISLCEKLRSY